MPTSRGWPPPERGSRPHAVATPRVTVVLAIPVDSGTTGEPGPTKTNGRVRMATLIEWSQVTNKVSQYERDHEYETRSLAFGHVVMEHLLGLNDGDVEDSITDGPQDRGIDAVVVREEGGRDVVHLFQFKCVEAFERASNNFPSN